MKTNTRWTLLGAAAVMSAGTIAGPLVGEAQAQKGRRNVLRGAGALTAYGVLRGNRTATVLGGLGTAAAYKRYRSARRGGRNQTIGQVFGNTAIYDSRGRRYSTGARFNSGQIYYNSHGQRIG